MVEWFRRFGDIPGISFTTHTTTDPTKLSGYAAVPEQHAFDVGGERHEYLEWSYGESRGSASPAQGRAFAGQRGDASTAVLQNCMEGLELPGVPGDYHFLIQATASELWRRRREEPGVIDDVEQLCRLDLQLVEARPDCVTYDQGQGPRFFAIEAFGTLVGLLEREGALHEALEMAERAACFGQGSPQREKLAARIAAVENEARG